MGTNKDILKRVCEATWMDGFTVDGFQSVWTW